MPSKKNLKDLATLSVPRPQVVKVLFAAYLFTHPQRTTFEGWVENEDTRSMMRMLRKVFNQKIVGTPESLEQKMNEFSDEEVSESKLGLIETLIHSSDMKRLKPKSIHVALPYFWNWVLD